MRISIISCLLLAGLGQSGLTAAATADDSTRAAADPEVLSEITLLRSHPVISAALAGSGTEQPPGPSNPLSQYETQLPHATEPDIPAWEKALLTAYLDKPSDVHLAKFLAIHHLSNAEIDEGNTAAEGKVLRHRIIASYFLNRAKQSGARERWLQRYIRRTQRQVNAVLAEGNVITLDEERAAHRYFRETFHRNEANRHIAGDVLLEELVREPGNVYTAFATTSLNLWVGGEADYDDPTVLYYFLVGSYVSIHTMTLSKDLEAAWEKNPTANTRFRMASILGGFSLLQRRWLAKAHGDAQAVQLIDDEHRQWRLVHRSFHAFTLGLPFFEEREHFSEGRLAFEDAVAHCAEEPVRTCSDRPRFSFNFLGFMLGYVDFLLKSGETDAAAQVLALREMPQLADTYRAWDLGRGPYEHRENNRLAIAALYQNAEPGDDPLHFLMKRRKWGMNTTTCQVCHQTQSKTWTQQQMDTVQLPPESVASVRVWPEVSTTWYGAVPDKVRQ